MRMYFVVHTFLNLYSDSVGYKITERNEATKHSHLMTIDKKVLSLKMADAFNPQ